MRKILQTLIFTAILSIPLLASGTATAASTCPVGYTGPDSSNICKSTTTYQCTVDNNNVVSITNQNAQGSISGNSNGSGSSSGGSVQTGTATNTSGASFDFTVTNKSQCTAVKTVAATTPPTTKTTKPVTPTKQSTPTALADTAGDSAVGWILAIAAIVAALALAARLGIVAYKQR